jgi:hypothetical protein
VPPLSERKHQVEIKNAADTADYGEEILGNRNRSKSQQLVSDPSNKCTIRGVAEGESGSPPDPIRAGVGQSGGRLLP